MKWHLIKDVEFSGINPKDAPDYSDAYIESGYYDGKPMTEEQLDEINNNRDLVYELLMNYL